MGILKWLSGLFSDDTESMGDGLADDYDMQEISNNSHSPMLNVDGQMMVNESVDISGDLYGSDLNYTHDNEFDDMSSSFDDSFGSGGFDDSSDFGGIDDW